jgi:hypothetical protein
VSCLKNKFPLILFFFASIILGRINKEEIIIHDKFHFTLVKTLCLGQSLYRLSKEETMGSHLFVAQAVETF